MIYRCFGWLKKRKPQPKSETGRVKGKPKPLYKTRYRWWKPLDIDEFASNLGDAFQVSFRENLIAEDKIEIFSQDRREIRVCADTVSALISPYRAVLYQREPAKLTEKDRKLLEIVMEAYPRGHYTPFL